MECLKSTLNSRNCSVIYHQLSVYTWTNRTLSNAFKTSAGGYLALSSQFAFSFNRMHSNFCGHPNALSLILCSRPLLLASWNCPQNSNYFPNSVLAFERPIQIWVKYTVWSQRKCRVLNSINKTFENDTIGLRHEVRAWELWQKLRVDFAFCPICILTRPKSVVKVWSHHFLSRCWFIPYKTRFSRLSLSSSWASLILRSSFSIAMETKAAH